MHGYKQTRLNRISNQSGVTRKNHKEYMAAIRDRTTDLFLDFDIHTLQ